MLRSKQGYKVEILCIRYDINSMRNLKYVLCTVMVVLKKKQKNIRLPSSPDPNYHVDFILLVNYLFVGSGIFDLIANIVRNPPPGTMMMHRY